MIKRLIQAFHLSNQVVYKATEPDRSSKWPALEKKFVSEHPKCMSCGSTNRLQVHHKKPFHLDPALELDETNLVTLCMDVNCCHIRVGHGSNFKAYNPDLEADLKVLEADFTKFDEIVAKAKANRKFELS